MSGPAIELPEPGRYAVEAASTRIEFATTHAFGTGTVMGTFAVVSGEIDVAPRLGESTVQVVIDADSIETGNRLRDSELRSRRFLGVARYPTMIFESSTLEAADHRMLLDGLLTARGRPVRTQVAVTRLAVSGDRFRATATARVDRRAHGIAAPPGVMGRHLDCTLEVEARFVPTA